MYDTWDGSRSYFSLRDVEINPNETWAEYRARGGTLSKTEYKVAKKDVTRRRPTPPSKGLPKGEEPPPAKSPGEPVPNPTTPPISTPGTPETPPIGGDGGSIFDSIENMFSGIPSTYLYIGLAAGVYFFFIKKR